MACRYCRDDDSDEYERPRPWPLWLRFTSALGFICLGVPLFVVYLAWCYSLFRYYSRT